MEVFSDPAFWVAVAFFTFLGLFGRKLWKALASGLDERTARIAAELEEAQRLRREAQMTLETYRKKHAESMKEAEAILAKARADAQNLATEAQAELKRMLDARARVAESKIAQAEKQAIEDVRNHVVDITIAAAKAIIIENLQAAPGDELMARAIADIERKVH